MVLMLIRHVQKFATQNVKLENHKPPRTLINVYTVHDDDVVVLHCIAFLPVLKNTKIIRSKILAYSTDSVGLVLFLTK